MVVNTLFEIEAIFPHLTSCFRNHDAPTQITPFVGTRKLGTERPNIEQRHSLAQQMGIGRKISGEVARQMTAIDRLGVGHIRPECLRHSGVPLQQRTEPNP